MSTDDFLKNQIGRKPESVFFVSMNPGDEFAIKPSLRAAGIRVQAHFADTVSSSHSNFASDEIEDMRNMSLLSLTSLFRLLKINYGKRIGRVLPLEEISKHLLRNPRVPIFIADDGSFKDFDYLARKILPSLPDGSQIIHPGILSNFIDIDLSDNAIAFGYPGSGNAPYQVIMMKILEHKVYLKVYLTENEIFALCTGLHSHLCRVIQNLFDELECQSVEIGYSRPGALNVAATWTEKETGQLVFLFLDDIPSKVFLTTPVYGTHTVLPKAMAEHYQRKGCRIFFCVRHPLDILVSLAAKSPIEHFEQLSKSTGASVEEVRKSFVVSQLSDPVWIDQTSKMLYAYMKNALRVAEHCTVLRYEDLVNRPRETILALFQDLEVDLDEELLDELVDSVGTADIGPPGHRFQPREGKWREFFPKGSLDIALDNHIGEITEALGYGSVSELQREIGDRDERGVDKTHVYEKVPATESAFLLSKVVYLSDLDYGELGLEYRTICGIKVVSNSKDKMEEFLQLLGNHPLERQMFGALRIPE